MPDKFDPYREALIIETETVWSDELDELDSDQRNRISAQLHASPENATHLEYRRMHTGFCRAITVTSEEVQRLSEG